MGFIIKTAFWLSLVLLLLPIDRQAAGITEGPSTLETFSAVRTVVSDVRGFCDRNASTCQTGVATVSLLREKAVYSAGMIQTWLATENAGQNQTLQVHAGTSGPAAQALAGGDDMALLIDASSNRIPASAYPPL